MKRHPILWAITPPEAAAAMKVGGGVPTSDIATEWLITDYDTPNLRMLAAGREDAWDQTLDELGVAATAENAEHVKLVAGWLLRLWRQRLRTLEETVHELGSLSNATTPDLALWDELVNFSSLEDELDGLWHYTTGSRDDVIRFKVVPKLEELEQHLRENHA